MRTLEPVLTASDRLVLRALRDRGGSATPGVLRVATGLPTRTISRALGRLQHAGLLGERSKGGVTLAPRRASSRATGGQRQSRTVPRDVRGAPSAFRPSHLPRGDRGRPQIPVMSYDVVSKRPQPAPTAEEGTRAANARPKTHAAAEEPGRRLSPFMRGLLGGGGL
jgi:hypothetical protein